MSANPELRRVARRATVVQRQLRRVTSTQALLTMERDGLLRALAGGGWSSMMIARHLGLSSGRVRQILGR
jgi:hypothetical protein